MQASLHYRQLIAPLPIPTAEQTESFAVYVAGAHSWYKHLPHDLPGIPFVVFLDPNAGRKRVETADGGAEYHDCVDQREKFHYNWMPTAEYLTKFGHWRYHHSQVKHLSSARVMAPDGTSIAISPDVVAAGTVYLTVHFHEGFGHIQGADSHAEAEHARQCAELRVALHRVRSLLTRGT